MTSILLSGFEPIELDLHDPEERLILTGVSWQQYSQLLDHFCDRISYRLTYLTGTLEIISPSRRPASTLLPELDLALLAHYIEANNPRLAVREFREQVRLRLLG